MASHATANDVRYGKSRTCCGRSAFESSARLFASNGPEFVHLRLQNLPVTRETAQDSGTSHFSRCCYE
jgi:hypothetical protein